MPNENSIKVPTNCKARLLGYKLEHQQLNITFDKNK